MKKIIYSAVLLLLLTCDLITAFAQDSTTTGKYPKAILVQLSVEKNRVEALRRARDYKRLAEIQNDAIEVMKLTVYDFNTYITHSKVYYYIDTNVDKIKSKEFEGILLDTDLTLATNIVVNKNDDNYIVAYYGYPPVNAVMWQKINKDPKDYVANNGELSGKGLVILNSSFQQLGFNYHGANLIDFRGRKKRKKRFYYNSKHFDCSYYPSARLVDGYTGGRIQTR